MEKKNLVLALYMGAVEVGDYKGSKGGYTDTVLLDFGKNSGSLFPDNQRYWSDTCLKYHLSYDWLMPVVHKMLADSEEQTSPFRFNLKEVLPFWSLNELYDFVYSYLENK